MDAEDWIFVDFRSPTIGVFVDAPAFMRRNLHPLFMGQIEGEHFGKEIWEEIGQGICASKVGRMES